MASTVHIAQGLKEDEDVEKTTLSETLNTRSSTFKHLTVKQIFLREPYRLKVHRHVQYLPKPPAENGFSDSKAPVSYQISQPMCLDTEELARRSAIYISLGTRWWHPWLKSCHQKIRDLSCCRRNWPSFKRPRSPQSWQDLQPHPTFSFYGGTPYSGTLAFSLRSWVL